MQFGLFPQDMVTSGGGGLLPAGEATTDYLLEPDHETVRLHNRPGLVNGACAA